MDARHPRLIRLGLAAAFALAYAGAFPFRAGELRADLGVVLGWVALVPFAALGDGLRPRAAFAWGTGAGTAAFAAVLFWLYVVVHDHGGASPPAAVAAVLLLAAYCGVHLGVAASLAALLAPRAGRLGLLVLPAAWVACEHLRSFDLAGGFPWAYLGYTAHLNGPLRELASLGGVYGLSLLLAVFAALVHRRARVPALGVLAGAHALGFALALAGGAAPRPAGTDGVRAAVVQGNIPQSLKWSPEWAAQSFRVYLEESRLAAAAGDVGVIVWPEAAVTVFLELEGGYRAALSELARSTGAVLLVGGLGYEREPAGPPRYFNSVFTLGPDGRFLDRYDKTRLVPFGEYVPARGVLDFLDAIATGVAFTDITPGPSPRVLDSLPGIGPSHALAPLVCYEVIYPDLVRAVVRRGARVLVNVTNDAWYGRTSGPHQFMAIATLRAAEHGLPMVRAANTGVSAFVDARGAVALDTPIFERRSLSATIPPARPVPTLYTRLGDWPVWLAWALLVAAGVRSAVGGGSLVRTGGDQGDRSRALGSGRARRRAAEASLTSTPSAGA